MDPVIRLTGARIALAASHAEKIDVDICRGRILPFDEARVSARYDMSGHLILPGLINAHDHLEFNLFPRLGSGPYANARQWAADIYRPDASPVREHLRVPKRVRLIWGGLKNLISGVTTVAHHNPWERYFTQTFPLRVLRRYGWAHSLAFSQDIVSRCLATPGPCPFIVHAGEGTDGSARAEVGRLDELGILSARSVLVHAVAGGPAEWDLIRKRAASIVWCPGSNLFTLGRTLCADVIRSAVPISLGTDSAMTGEGDLIDEIRVAQASAGLNADEIYPLVTTRPAQALRLRKGHGTIAAGAVADLVAVKDAGQTPAGALMNLHPQLVLVRGKIMLASDRFAKLTGPDFYPLEVEGRGRWLVRANIPRLHAQAVEALGPDIRLAGRRILR